MAYDYKKGYTIRSRGRFDPGSDAPFTLSRSKIDLFIECPRCAYLDMRLGLRRPSSFPMNLNNAVDTLLKKEFDTHRIAQTPHPLVTAYGLDLVPLQNEHLDEWRDALTRGISFHHKETNLILRGGIDDIWHDPKTGEVVIVDYKATSKDSEVSIDADWQIAYKRQIEVYQWLFKQNGYTVSPKGYFVYVNGRTDKEAFDGKIEFDSKLIPYEGKTDWIEPTLRTLKICLESDRIPLKSSSCEYCGYVDTVRETMVALYKARQGNNEGVITTDAPSSAMQASDTSNESAPKKKRAPVRKIKKEDTAKQKPKTEQMF